MHKKLIKSYECLEKNIDKQWHGAAGAQASLPDRYNTAWAVNFSHFCHFKGPDTILASHLVGLYCHKEIIGQSYGETLEIAEEMAARDALRNILGTAEHSQSPPWGREPGPGAGDKPNTNMESLSVEPRNIINC